LTLADRAVWAPLDHGLEEEADTLAAVWATGSEPALLDVAASIGSESDLGPTKFLRLISADGREVARFGGGPFSVPHPSRMGGHVFRTIENGADAYRVVSLETEEGRLIEIGVSARRPLQTLSRLRVGVPASAAALVLVLTALAWAITARATRELEGVAAELETIEAGGLEHRLAARRTTEADRLVDVLNRLLGRLEATMGHLRRFTADAAHELRTPVAALRAQLDATLSRDGSREELRDGVIDALEQADRLGRLAEDLLTLSAIEATPGLRSDAVGPIALEALVREVAESLQPIAQEQGRPFAVHVNAPAWAEGSAALLRRALLNLLDNAFRHSPPDAAVEICLLRNSEGAVIEIRDGGPGFAAGEASLLFDRFHRGSAARSGSGLGLAICREICRAHGGDVTLERAPGGGTIARIALPERRRAGFTFSS
jgi:signal transduction histidine kinase